MESHIGQSSESGMEKEGRRLIIEAAALGLSIRLLGGVAIWVRASDETRGLLGRHYPDLDFAAHGKQSRALRRFLEESGYKPLRTFNATHGARRLLYHAPDGSFQIDLFLDVFEMCHKLDFSERLEVEDATLPAAELLLTKLQIVRVNRKDIGDVLMLLCDHELAAADGPSLLNVDRVATVCAADWGLYTTTSDNLGTVREMVPDFGFGGEAITTLTERIDGLTRHLEAAPKSRTWKLRAKIGRRLRWYEEVEEVTR